MTKLTKAKARELVKRELGAAASRQLEIDPTVPHIPQFPWYRVELGNLTVTVYTAWDGQVTTLLLNNGLGSLSSHYFTDTLEPFYQFSEMEESQNRDDQAGENRAITHQREVEVRNEIRRHYSKQPALRCRHCGCTDDHACIGGCHWVEPDLCSACVGRD